jgi:hypothetical protein
MDIDMNVDMDVDMNVDMDMDVDMNVDMDMDVDIDVDKEYKIIESVKTEIGLEFVNSKPIKNKRFTISNR